MLARNWLLAALAVIVCAASGYAVAQNAGQVLLTFVGNELIQVQPANTAAIAYTSVSALRDGRQYVQNAPLTGFSIALTVDQSVLTLKPAATIAAGTVTFPATAVDGKTVNIFTTQTITALTLASPNTATIDSPVTTLVANADVAYIYSKAANTWWRFQ